MISKVKRVINTHTPEREGWQSEENECERVCKMVTVIGSLACMAPPTLLYMAAETFTDSK